MRYELTRYIEASTPDGEDEETTHILDLDFNVEPAEYEDGYLFYAGSVELNAVTDEDGNPFELTQSEKEDVCDYIHRHTEMPRHYYRGDRW